MRAKKEINIIIGEQIRLAREQVKLTQEQLAERIEVSPQYISDAERGVVGVSISTLKKICTCLGVSSDQLLFQKKAETRAIALADKCNTLSDEQFAILAEIVNGFVKAIDTERQAIQDRDLPSSN